MPRPLEVALGKDRVVAEGRLRLALRRGDRLLEVGPRADDAHPPPASARSRLDEQRELVALCEDGHARLPRVALCSELVSAGSERLRRRPNPDQPRCLDRLGEVRVLGEKPVAGVDRHRRRPTSLPGCAPPSGGTTRSRRPRRRRRACSAPASSGATTATVAIPSSRHVRKIRTAISPRFATSSFAMGTAEL